jgi:hypothetical protein
MAFRPRAPIALEKGSTGNRLARPTAPIIEPSLERDIVRLGRDIVKSGHHLSHKRLQDAIESRNPAVTKRLSQAGIRPPYTEVPYVFGVHLAEQRLVETARAMAAADPLVTIFDIAAQALNAIRYGPGARESFNIDFGDLQPSSSISMQEKALSTVGEENFLIISARSLTRSLSKLCSSYRRICVTSVKLGSPPHAP